MTDIQEESGVVHLSFVLLFSVSLDSYEPGTRTSALSRFLFYFLVHFGRSVLELRTSSCSFPSFGTGQVV